MTTFARGIARDLRYAIRSLRRSPVFTTVALLMLGVTSGAMTSAFSVIDGVLLKPLPYPRAGELVALTHLAPGAGLPSGDDRLALSPAMFLTYVEHNRTFQSLGIWVSAAATITGLAEPEEIRSAFVSDGLLQTLGVPPLVGRWLDSADQDPNGARTVVLTYEYWQRRFGGDTGAIGRTLTMDSESSEIIGVMPAGFRIVDDAVDVIAPTRLDRSRLNVSGFAFAGVARLKPDVTIAEANADITRMLPIWVDSWPPAGRVNSQSFLNRWRVGPALTALRDDVVRDINDILWIVMATVAMVFAIACANITNLLLVRVSTRDRELAIRSALGAGRWHVYRVLLLESGLLGLIGGLLGLVLAFAGIRILLAIGPENLPRLNQIGLDARTLGFTLAISLLVGLVLGVAPALKQSGPIATALHAGGRGASRGRAAQRVQNVLAVAQVTLALVLLVSSGLMFRTFAALRDVDPGFTDPTQLQTLRITIPFSLVPDAERVVQAQRDIMDALGAIPSVSGVALASSLPMDGFSGASNGWYFENWPDRPPDTPPPFSSFKYISPGIFDTVGTRLIAGRDLDWTDVLEGRDVLLVSENLARYVWREPAAALGQRARTSLDLPWATIVGVVEDVHDNGLEEPAPTIAYWPMFRPASESRGSFAWRWMTVAIRSPLAGTPGLLRQIEQAVWSVNPALPLASVRTMQQVYDQSLARTSFALVMLAIAGAVSLVLGVVGLYGVLSYAVAQRRRDIAIRLAVGAQQHQVRRRFIRYGLGIAGLGIVIGIGVAAAVTQMMSSLLFGVRTLDAPTYAAVASILTLVAVLASYLPARRASAIDPAAALSSE